MRTTTLEVDGKRFFTLTWGEPGKTCFVGVHGLTANAYHMAAVSEFLAASGGHALAYDVRGRGDSPPAAAPSTLRRHAEDLAAMVEALPAQRVFVMGYSMGAFIASIAAGLTSKISGMIFFDGGGLLSKADAEKLLPSLARMEKVFSGPEDYIAAVKPSYAGLGLPWNAYIETAVRHEIGCGADGLYRYKGQAERVKEDLLDIAAFDHKAVYAAVSCPVLLVHAQGGLGEGASLYSEASYTLTRKCLTDLEFYQTPANHYTMMLERQPALHERVWAFVTRCGA